MRIDFPALFKELKDGVLEIARSTVKDYAAAAVKDGMNILNNLKTELKIWVKDVADGKMSADDFEYNLKSYAALISMVTLKQEGLALVSADRFRNDVINLIIDTVTGKIK